MTDTFELTLNNPLTEEQWDMIADVDFDRTDRIWFHTKHGKEVEFTKVIRCKDCKHFLKARNEDEYDSCAILFEMQDIPLETDEDKYCAWAERKNHD